MVLEGDLVRDVARIQPSEEEPHGRDDGRSRNNAVNQHHERRTPLPGHDPPEAGIGASADPATDPLRYARDGTGVAAAAFGGAAEEAVTELLLADLRRPVTTLVIIRFWEVLGYLFCPELVTVDIVHVELGE